MKVSIDYKDSNIISILDTLTMMPNNLDLIKARDVWDISKQGEGNVVAVLDTGVDTDHQSLARNIIGGCNFSDDDQGDPTIFEDYEGHGTHVAGIIAAYQDNGRGIFGVAPKSKLLILKVMNRNGVGTINSIIQAIDYAMNWVGPNGEKVKIINMSLGGPSPNETLHRAIKAARQKGITIVAAAGNSGDGDPNSFERSYPGFYQEVIQVGSVNQNLEPSFFSNNNVNIDFVAPGENIYSTHLDNKFVKLTGTSMAAPYVAGSVALILNMMDRSKSVMVPYMVYHYLLTHAKKLNYSIHSVGNGFIQLTSEKKLILGTLVTPKKLKVL
ncbi:S8 family peptidase [Pseudogracilibacillus auburnensis]|uniref:Type II signal peptidase n=1 Tax=Pseudogracilibacillus auburnensis TaxID=1494959 RepID=A0A2V3VNK8_9BACI|nr:S8 family peptidase [Pseudogracilibacillus auburnensis]MBO1001812.1 S8 family peptidase [Pseudogracilibacillus auburnensis]PXW83402.1 type II signal peptidase [Pseudogracilibacillus auburnensis]